jgi:flagellar M-ring protein FliF
VTVISRQFAGAATDMADAAPWYDNSWLPMLARNLTAIIIALLVLFLGVRPLAKALMKKREDATAPGGGASLAGIPAAAAGGAGAPGPLGVVVAPPVSLDQMQGASGYDERVDLVRGFTRDNPARAALAVRDMIKADQK